MAELHRGQWLLLQRRLRASPHRATHRAHPWPLDKPNAIAVTRTFPSTDPSTNIPTNNCAADDVDAFDNPNLGADPRAIGAAVGGAIVAAVPAPVCAAVLERIAGSVLCGARATAGSKARPRPAAVPIGQQNALSSEHLFNQAPSVPCHEAARYETDLLLQKLTPRTETRIEQPQPHARNMA